MFSFELFKLYLHILFAGGRLVFLTLFHTDNYRNAEQPQGKKSIVLNNLDTSYSIEP